MPSVILDPVPSWEGLRLRSMAAARRRPRRCHAKGRSEAEESRSDLTEGGEAVVCRCSKGESRASVKYAYSRPEVLAGPWRFVHDRAPRAHTQCKQFPIGPTSGKLPLTSSHTTQSTLW